MENILKTDMSKRLAKPGPQINYSKFSKQNEFTNPLKLDIRKGLFDTTINTTSSSRKINL